jgi:hypothetical protein
MDVPRRRPGFECLVRRSICSAGVTGQRIVLLARQRAVIATVMTGVVM